MVRVWDKIIRFKTGRPCFHSTRRTVHASRAGQVAHVRRGVGAPRGGTQGLTGCAGAIGPGSMLDTFPACSSSTSPFATRIPLPSLNTIVFKHLPSSPPSSPPLQSKGLDVSMTVHDERSLLALQVGGRVCLST